MRSDQTPRSDSSRIPNLKLPTSNSQPQTPSLKLPVQTPNRLPDQEPDPGVHIDGVGRQSRVHIDGVGRHLTNLRIFEAAKDIHITKAYMSTAVCTLHGTIDRRCLSMCDDILYRQV